MMKPLWRGARVALVLLGLLSRPYPITAAAAQAAAPAPAVISSDRLMETVRELSSKDYEGRRAGTPGGAKARGWIRDRFEGLGLQPLGDGFEHRFSFTPPGSGPGGSAAATVEGVNIIGRCAGTDASLPAFVVSAHYDHLGLRDGRLFPGADDNASGVAVLLALAAVCRAEPFRHNLILAAFDAEEGGLRGAEAFVADLPVPRDRLALDINLDMVARGDKGDIFISGLRHYPRFKPLLDRVAQRAPITVRFGHDEPGSGHDDWTMQSDHGAFHKAGIPFIYFGVEDHPDYHQPTDTADRIDPAFFGKAANVILDAVRALDAGLR